MGKGKGFLAEGIFGHIGCNGCGVVFAELYQYNEGVLRLFLLPDVFLGAFLINSLLKRLLFLVKRGKILIIYGKTQ